MSAPPPSADPVRETSLADAIRRLSPQEAMATDWLPRLLTEAATSPDRLAGSVRTLAERGGVQVAWNTLARMELAAGVRKPTLAIYDHTFQLIGGGQRYGLILASLLQERFDVTLIANRPVSLADFTQWYGLDLSRCRVRIVPLPFYGPGSAAIDPARAFSRDDNPFEPVALASGEYDVFVNNSMLEMVTPLAPVSVFVCHFPERGPSRHFQVQHYRHLVTNSRYTARWIERKWGLTPTRLIYPPIERSPAPDPRHKKPLILSAARFETGGTKHQLTMIEAFARLIRQYPEESAGWQLVLAGGSAGDTPYLSRVRQAATLLPPGRCEIRVNIPGDELADLYARASVFWHLCGLYQRDPARVEHFGMTTVEAMQAGAVPVVFDGGGQREIVEEGRSGRRVSTVHGLIEATQALLTDAATRQALAAGAIARAAAFTGDRFARDVQTLFDPIMEWLCGKSSV